MKKTLLMKLGLTLKNWFPNLTATHDTQKLNFQFKFKKRIDTCYFRLTLEYLEWVEILYRRLIDMS